MNNAVTLSMTDSVWNVTGLSYLRSLTVDADSVINGDVYQNGEKVELKAGSYDDVVVVPAGVALAEAEAETVAAIEAAAAAGVVPADRSELVANTDLGTMSLFSFSGEASGETSGEASAASGDAS